MILKRLFDIFISALALFFLSPILLTFIFLVWVYDFQNPFYIAPRVGMYGKSFSMIKIRSMVVNADKSGVDSTSASDSRITPLGVYIRKLKLDELTQLINVFKGDMSLVGPRPNVKREVLLYTDLERTLLNVKPGITDIASIVFSDESEILSGSADPDIDYNQLIRPGKGLLGVYYVRNSSFFLDLCLILITVVSIFSRKKSLSLLRSLLVFNQAPSSVIRVASRRHPLTPSPPYGGSHIVTSRFA